jgi:hypothetical protein
MSVFTHFQFLAGPIKLVWEVEGGWGDENSHFASTTVATDRRVVELT